MEVIEIHQMKLSGYSLDEIGYYNPMDDTMYIDLIVLQAAINHKQKLEQDKIKK